MDKKGLPQPEIPNELARKMNQWRQTNPKATLTEIEEAVEVELAELHPRFAIDKIV